ncbi:MAG: hypothetical protein H7Y07_08400 [Pyrinomonadaceae bacterium]|nr:hypothetical protein [Sphingobacteriaceae bacterium]
MNIPKKKIEDIDSADNLDSELDDPIEKKQLVDEDDDFDEPLDDLGFDDLDSLDDDDDF